MTSLEYQLISIFIEIDNFCNHFEKEWAKNELLLKSPKRDKRGGNIECSLSLSEVMCILVMFHHSKQRTFKDYYQHYIRGYWHHYFPRAPSYNRFIQIEKRAFIPLCCYFECSKGEAREIQYVDSTKLEVCHNRRIYSHKVFRDVAHRGKTSTGWFYGMKLHLVINDIGELLSYVVTAGNVDDRVPVESMMSGLSGFLFGDKGYISTALKERLEKKMVRFITKLRANMKKPVLKPIEKWLLAKRGVVESVIEQLKSLCHIQHTRHRSVWNYSVNLVAGLIAYNLKKDKPSIYNRDKALNLCPTQLLSAQTA